MKTKDIIENSKKALGVESLTGMQSKMADSKSNEIILLAPTGSGKTLAMALRVLREMDAPNAKRRDGHADVAVVIMAPSRELVTQIYGVIKSLAPDYRVAALYGGHSMLDEQRTLTITPDVVVATPGRLLDHLNRRQIDLKYTRVLVLDEYDKSLELGFAEEMKRISRKMPRIRVTVLTSATRLAEMPDYLALQDVDLLDYTGESNAPDVHPDIKVHLVRSINKDKLACAEALLASLQAGKAIVFVNHRESAERVGQMLARSGLPVSVYHGGLDQQDRQTAIDMFNNGSTPILISTDLGSRGLDIDNVNYVIHYHISPTNESWTHRNGRTARMGGSGDVYVIQGPDEELPDYIEIDDKAEVNMDMDCARIKSGMGTLYFNAGKREKISRGDIAGYLINKGGLQADEIGKINVYDHYALAAVEKTKVKATLAAIRSEKIKNQRVRVSEVIPTAGL